MKSIQTLNQIAAGGLEPQLTILLDVPVERGLKLAMEKKNRHDRLERAGLAFHQRVRQRIFAAGEKRASAFSRHCSAENDCSDSNPNLERSGYLSKKMSLDSIIGQPLAVDLCRTWLKRQTTNPLLMYGPEGVGKKTLALEVAKALNCAAKNRDACDDCVSCKKIASGNHPDVRVIDFAWQAMERKEPIEKQQSLRIETVMTERHRLLQSTVEGSWKVSIIDGAHRLTADAANVLLKILEEPPAEYRHFSRDAVSGQALCHDHFSLPAGALSRRGSNTAPHSRGN